MNSTICILYIVYEKMYIQFFYMVKVLSLHTVPIKDLFTANPWFALQCKRPLKSCRAKMIFWLVFHCHNVSVKFTSSPSSQCILGHGTQHVAFSSAGFDSGVARVACALISEHWGLLIPCEVGDPHNMRLLVRICVNSLSWKEVFRLLILRINTLN